ncbi:MAG TPA: protein kinase [Gemmataceae bacterium]|nr:protein kinase [Gemmataceae bacterium]
MSIFIRCPNAACQAGASVSDTLSGRTVKCKRCGTPFLARPTADGSQSDTRPVSVPAEDPFPTLPATFGRYRVLKVLGKGGMGAVYLAEDTELGRKVALKLPSFGPSAPPTRVERFLREARAAAALHHPNICTIFDVGREGGRPYLTMAYIEGRPLADAIDADQPMPERQAATLARQIALALAHAHDRGVVHRDLKPANVMLTAGGDPVVMDFGLAKRLAEEDTAEAKLTREGAVIGTPSYMAPEQVRGESAAIGPRTDVYALGALLFELLTGRTPFEGPVGVVLASVLTGTVPAVKDVRREADPRLDAICRKAMAKDPAERFPTMGAFAEALAECVNAPAAQPAFPPTLIEARPGPPPLPPTVTKEAAAPFYDLEVVEPKKPRAARRRLALPRQWGLWATIGAMVLAAVLVVVVLLTVRTRYGEVVIELSDPAAKVEVKVDGERIDLTGLDRPITLKAGEHGLTVTGPDFETVTRSFTVKKGEREVVKVTLAPAPKRDGVTPRTDPVPRGVVPLSEPEMDARDKAIAWLKKEQTDWGGGLGDWEEVRADVTIPTGGPTALALLALLECGVPLDDPVVARGMKYLRSTQIEPNNLYVVAVQTQVFCAANQREDADRIKANVRWLENAAAYDGPKLLGWSYSNKPAGRADTSCTRYAVAALHAANRAGYLPTNLGLWGDVRDLFVRTQQPGGGWRYSENNPKADAEPTRTMTASGALCLVLAAQATPPTDPEADPVLAAGLDWLARNFRLDGPWPYYNLDVLAALGRARGMKLLGSGAPAREWFREGSEWLLKEQKFDGRFVGPDLAEKNPVVATAFALRFLASRPGGSKVGKAQLGEPELVKLSELPADQNKSGPWLSADGRALYWADKRGAEHWIWRADRPWPGKPFEEAVRLFSGHDMTLSADMTEVILVDQDPNAEGSQKFALFAGKKGRPTDVVFGSWRRLTEFVGYGFVAAPSLAADGLTLYAEQFGDRSLPPNVRFRRANRNAPWGQAEAVPINGLEKGTLRFPFVSPDGRYLFGNNDMAPSGMVMLTSTDGGKTFESPRAIHIPGGSMKGKFPRYVPETNELFFGEVTSDPTAELYVIRNFDPERDTRPVK